MALIKIGYIIRNRMKRFKNKNKCHLFLYTDKQLRLLKKEVISGATEEL
jgi:hypothetical protein